FDFDDEVTQLQQVLFKFETAGGSPVAMLPLESTVRSVGGLSTSTGPSSASTTAGGSSHSHTVDVAGHQHQINVNPNVNPGYPDVKLNTDAGSFEHTGGSAETINTNATTGTTILTSSD